MSFSCQPNGRHLLGNVEKCLQVGSNKIRELSIQICQIWGSVGGHLPAPGGAGAARRANKHIRRGRGVRCPRPQKLHAVPAGAGEHVLCATRYVQGRST